MGTGFAVIGGIIAWTLLPSRVIGGQSLRKILVTAQRWSEGGG
jgi:hypothetical protein